MLPTEIHGFFDIHTHILPGVDDGAADISQARKMLQAAYAYGTRSLFLTPHYRGRFRETYSPERYRRIYAYLLEWIADDFPDLKIYLGSEVTYETDAPELLAQGKILSMNDSRYVLIELFSQMPPSQVIAAVDGIMRKGFIPIIAHIDRYEVFRKNTELAQEVLDMGALIQLNADSVLGENGAQVKRYCHNLLKEDQVHFIASDAHDLVRRAPILRQCFLHVHKKYGAVTAARLFYQNAQNIVDAEKEKTWKQNEMTKTPSI